MASATQELSDEISDTGPKVCHLLHKHPPGLVSARVVADVCQIFMWSMMMNVRCVIVFRIDVQSLLQHVVHENKKIVAAKPLFRTTRRVFTSSSIIITVGPTTSDPVSSEDRLYSGASANTANKTQTWSKSCPDS